MKNSWLVKVIVLVGLGAPIIWGSSPVLAAVSVSTKLNGVKFTVCSEGQKRCLTLSSKKGDGGTVRPIYTFKNVEYVLEDRVSKENKTGKGLKAVYNTMTNELTIISIAKNGDISERVFDLKTLDQKIYVVN